MTILRATGLTVEYDTHRGQDAIVINPFPALDPDPAVVIFGSVEELRGVVDTMQSLLDALED